MKSTMARFLNNLNCDIQDILGLQEHRTLKELVHQATKVDQQLKKFRQETKFQPHSMER